MYQSMIVRYDGQIWLVRNVPLLSSKKDARKQAIEIWAEATERESYQADRIHVYKATEEVYELVP